MKRSHLNRGFTIIELLVVVSIIALLVGILLPAIGKAREQAKLTTSQSNLKQLGTAVQIYAAEWGDRQYSTTPDSLGSYGTSHDDAWSNYFSVSGAPTQSVWPVLGTTPPATIWFWNSTTMAVPMRFEGTNAGFGGFRFPNARQLGQYMSGKFYDPVYFAPKDLAAVASIEVCESFPGEWCPTGSNGPASGVYAPSYCFSPAAMFNPSVMRNEDKGGFQAPYTLDAGYRSPGMSQALYPDLKTHIMEHNWLQNTFGTGKECNPAVAGGMYDGCEPYYFNHGYSSTPVALFYDGHIEMVGNLRAQAANGRQIQQAGYGLWSTDTPLGGGYDDDASGGYFNDWRSDWTSTAHHILTTDGIRGRDMLGDG